MANKEIGRTGLSEFSGIISEDILRELRGKEGYKKYNEMRLNSPVVGALLLANEQAIRKVSWNFTSTQGENDPRIELLNYARDNMRFSWNDHITEALTMLWAGYSIFEFVYKRDKSGMVIWDKLAPRGQDTVYRWVFNYPSNPKYDPKKGNGDILGFEQMSPPDYQVNYIPFEAMLLYRTRVERNNPEGRSILRTAWVSYYYTKHLQQIEAIGVERDLAGLPKIKLPAGASATGDANDDASKAQTIVRNIRNDEQAGIVIPDGWEFELVSTGGSRQFDTDKIIRRYESRILMSSLSQFIMLGQDGVGSLALSKDQTDFFNMSVNSISDIIAETFTKYAIPPLLRMNGYDTEGIKLEHTPAGDTDISLLADALQKVGGYVTWDGEDELWLRQTFNMPEKDIATLQGMRDEADERRAEQAQAIKQSMAKSDKDEEKEDELSIFASQPKDERKRAQFERKLQQALNVVLGRQQKKIVKQVKEMRRM